MKKTKIVFLLTAISLLMSCSSDQETNAKMVQETSNEPVEKQVMKTKTPKSDEENSPKHTKKVILERTIKRVFSNPETEDQFTVSFVGSSESDYEGKVVLEIVDANGNELFKNESPMTIFIAHNVVEGTDKERAELVQNGMDHYFDNFDVPAIPPDENCEDEMCDEELWNEIQSDPTTVGFFCPMNEGGGCRIAYSKSIRK